MFFYKFNSSLNAPSIAAIIIAAVVVAVAIVLVIVFWQKNRRLISTIKDKLNNLQDGAQLTLTKSDEINSILLQIDKLGGDVSLTSHKYSVQKENLKIILENAHFGILALSSSQKILFSNQTAKGHFNFNQEARPIDEIIRHIEFLKKLNKCLKTNTDYCFDLTTPQNEILELRILPVKSEKIACVITSQIVTKERNLIKEKQDFFVNASHELNTPLTAVMGYSEILKHEKKFNQKFVEEIYTQSNRMRNLITDMLKLSKLEAVPVLNNSDINMQELIDEVVNSFTTLASDKNITIVKEEVLDTTINADRLKMQELVDNLVSNAVKYTNNGGKVVISLKKDGGKHILSVTDTGIGIAAHHLPRIFERFYRTDESRTTSGTGLGLSIVKHICNIYGFTVDVKSTLGVGTSISIVM